MDPYIPFCGTPPLPAELLARWTLDPGLLAGLALALIAGMLALGGRQPRRRFALGWALVAILFVSPLCALSMALFSARVGQHLLLTLVAAPILAASLPAVRLPPLAAAAIFAGLFWTWHAPVPYAATLAGDGAYWAMHLSLLGSAVLFWAALRGQAPHAPFRTALAALFTGAQMTILSVLLIFSANPWHGWHTLTTVPYGMSALSDQQLAGALMWVAGGAVLLIAVAALSTRFLRASATVEPAR